MPVPSNGTDDKDAPCKRQRSYNESAVTEWFSTDAKERIHEIDYQRGNPNFTRGAFGEISIAIDTSTNDGTGLHLAAIKTISRATVSSGNSFASSWGNATGLPSSSSKSKLTREVFNELVALRMLQPHPCIIPLLGIYESKKDSIPGGLSLAFPYHPVDLQMILDRQLRVGLPALPFGIVQTIAKDIIFALSHCHANGVLHRDIKPGNFLVTSAGRIQLCDFGLAKPCPSLCKEDTGSQSLPIAVAGAAGSKGVCTLYYRPPEVLLGGLASHPSVDIYSAGLVVAELVLGIPLFSGQNTFDQLGRIFNVLGTPNDEHWPHARSLPDFDKIKYPPTTPKSWTEVLPRTAECPFLQDWLSMLVALDPMNRASAKELLEHAWFSSPPNASTHQKVAEELIPVELRVPSILFSPDDPNNSSSLEQAEEYAVIMAARRRTYGLQNVSEKLDPEHVCLIAGLCNQLGSSGFPSLTSLCDNV